MEINSFRNTAHLRVSSKIFVTAQPKGVLRLLRLLLLLHLLK
jgi:hypothetical protein